MTAWLSAFLAYIPRHRAKVLRASAGASLIALSAGATVPSLLNNVGIEAVVNAHMVVIRAPIEGTVLDATPMGTKVAKGDVLVRVQNSRLNRSFNGELRTEAETLRERVAALEVQRAELEAAKSVLLQRAEKFRSAQIERLNANLRETGARFKAAQALVNERKANLERKSYLKERDIVSPAALEGAQLAYTQAVEERSALAAMMERINSELKSASASVFVSDGQNDVPYSRQRIDEIDLRLQDIAARRHEYEIRVTEIEKQRNGEEARLSAGELFVQPAPVNGVIWRRLAVTGSDVVIGTELSEILDCSDLFLDVTLNERKFDDIAVGAEAIVRLIGSDKEVKGTVRSVRGSGAITEDRFLAAKVPTREKNEFQIIVALDAGALGAEAGNFCQVGRTARVYFPRNGLISRAMANGKSDHDQ